MSKRDLKLLGIKIGIDESYQRRKTNKDNRGYIR